ncbi:hypothetical protein MTO96_013073 [Rhipicephalus appendiculatus]
MPKTNSAVFYVLFVDLFGVSREAASWPKTIESATSNFMGIVVNTTCRNPRLIGTSYGLLLIGSSIFIMSYFDHYRGVAAGIRFAGVSLAGVIGPPLLAELTKKYGLQGCLLITGGLTLNMIPLSMMLRNPRPVACSLSWRRCKSKRTSTASSIATVATTAETAQNMKSPTPSTGMSPTKTATHEKNNGNAKADTVATKPRNDLGNEYPSGPTANQAQLPNASELREGANFGLATQTLNVLTKPCFYIITISMVAADFTLPLLGTTIVDYARDKELPPEESWLLVTFLSVGSMCGHLVIPILSDKLTCGRTLIAALSFTVLSVCFILMPQVQGFAAVGAVTFVAGGQNGYLNTLKPVLVADYLGVGSVAVSWSLIGLASLPLTFCEPMIIGAFRDNSGSYDRLYHLCSVISLLAASLLALQSCLDARNSTTKFKNASIPSTPIPGDNAAVTQDTPRRRSNAGCPRN